MGWTADNLSPVQFGFAPHREKIAQDVDSKMRRTDFKPKRIRVDQGTFRATQTKMSRSTVEHYAGAKVMKDRYGGRPEVIKRGDEHVVWNGHHRIAAARRKGQKTMTVDYQDVTHSEGLDWKYK